MRTFQCWFCDQGIERTDIGAAMVTVESLWRWDAGSRNDYDPSQSIYLHSQCAKDRMKGATMEIDPSVFADED